MKKNILLQIKEILTSIQKEELVVDSLEAKVLKDLLNSKDKVIVPIISGYKSAKIETENNEKVLTLTFPGARAKITIKSVQHDENNNIDNYTFYIRKLSDYDKTLSYYNYNQSNNTLDYISCSKEKDGISTYKGFVELDEFNKEHVVGVSRSYTYESLNENLPMYNFNELPISVVSNVVLNERINVKPSYEDYIESRGGNIITAETNVNIDDHRLFKKGSIIYNSDIEEKTLTKEIRGNRK